MIFASWFANCNFVYIVLHEVMLFLVHVSFGGVNGCFRIFVCYCVGI